MNIIDRAVEAVAPQLALRRARARAALSLVRNYEAASRGRRTQGWSRTQADVNRIGKVAISELRMHARDLVRNNGWSRRALRSIVNNTTGGWGIHPEPSGAGADTAAKLWRDWSDTTTCDADGLRTFSGIQAQVVRSCATDGEILIRRRRRKPQDGVPLNFQLQILEADHIDSTKESESSASGGPIINGVEFDLLGRRTAYWLFPTHPGAGLKTEPSKRVPAEDIAHIFHPERPGQVRGISWFGAGVVPLKDLDEFEDAELVKQKIAACFSAFVTDLDGLPSEGDMPPLTTSLEPGLIQELAPGQSVEFATPAMTVQGDFTTRALRKVAAALGVTYEDLSGDYSQVNFSSARMARISHWGNVRDWQWNMLVPMLCQRVWQWVMDAAMDAGLLREVPHAEWTAPPMPMIEPDREGLAYSRLVRNGVMTHAEMVREQGRDPRVHWREYADGLKQLDKLNIKLDSDVRHVTAAGQLHPDQQALPAGDGGEDDAEKRILAMIEGAIRGDDD